MDERTQTFYRVDPEGLILDVGGDWDSFALDNGATECCADRVVGTPLFRHITGDSTRLFMDTLFMRARMAKGTLEFDYRCDSPEARRYMVMELEGNEGGIVTVWHRLVREVPSDIKVRLQVREGASGLVLRCSVCNHLKLDGEWKDPFEFSDDQDWYVAHTVCPTCSKRDWRVSES